MGARTTRILLLLAFAAGILQAADDTIREIQVKTLDDPTADAGDVLAVIRTRVGDSITQPALSRDERALLDTKRFSAVSVNIQTNVQELAGGNRVVYEVRRRPTLSGPVEIVGLDYFSRGKVEDWLALAEGAPVDEQILADKCRKVRDEYRKHYFPNATVTASILPADAAGRQKGRVKAHVTIVEGPRIKPDAYVFHGNRALASGDLRATIGDRPWWDPRSWFSTSPYGEEQLAKARQDVLDAYLDAGYLDAQVSPARFVPLPKDPKRARVEFDVTEGPCYRVRDVTINGVKLFPESSVRAAAGGLKPGVIASRKAIQDAAKGVRDYYGARGYIDTVVAPRPVPDADGAPVVTVRMDVREGSLVRLRNIQVRGNTRTREKVVLREVPLSPGQVLDDVRVQRSETRLKNLGLFKDVRHSVTSPSAEGMASGTNDFRDLVFEVEEGRTGSFMIGGGFSSVDRIVGYVQVQQSNFDILNWPYFTGGGQKARAGLEIGSKHRSIETSLTEPWFMDKPLALTVDLYLRSLVYDEYTCGRVGGDIGVSYPVQVAGIPFGSLGARYTLEQVELRKQLAGDFYYYPDGPDYRFTDEPDRALNSALQVSWEYDTRNQIFVPTRGTQAGLFAELAGSVLGGENDTFRVGAHYRHWFPLWWKHVLSLRGRVETISSYGGGEVPIYDRLFLGGGRTVRGVRYRDLGPKVVSDVSDPTDMHPVGGQTTGLVSAEYTIPVFEALRLAAFTDAGSNSRDSYDYANLFKNYAWTAGLGLRIDIPGFPIRLDYATPIVKDDKLTRDDRFVFWIGFE